MFLILPNEASIRQAGLIRAGTIMSSESLYQSHFPLPALPKERM